MIYNIDSSWEVKKRIYLIFLITVAILSVYAVIWIKCVMKRPMFKPYQIKEVMAMESDLYQINHNPEVAKKLHLDAVPRFRAYRRTLTPELVRSKSLHNSQLFVKVIVSQHGLVFLGCQSGIRLEIVHKVGLVEVSQIGSNLRQRAPDVLILV